LTKVIVQDFDEQFRKVIGDMQLFSIKIDEFKKIDADFKMLETTFTQNFTEFKAA
jgi:hypothetical protein